MDRWCILVFICRNTFLFISIIYFTSRNFLRNFLLLSSLIYIFKAILTDKHAIFILDLLFFTEYLYLFILGLGFYYLYLNNTTNTIHCFISSLIFFLINNSNNFNFYDAIAISIIFFTFLILNYIKLNNYSTKKPILSKIGIASYSLYLLHQNIGVNFNYRISSALNLNNYEATIIPLITIFIMTFLSTILFKFYETPANRILLKNLLPQKTHKHINKKHKL